MEISMDKLKKSINKALELIAVWGEPSNIEPGGSPYAGGGSLAEYGKKEKEKDDEEETPEDIEMEVVTVLEGLDIAPFLTDNVLLMELLEELPMLGDANKKLDELLGIAALKPAALNQDPPEGTGQYTAPGPDADYDTEVEEASDDEEENEEENENEEEADNEENEEEADEGSKEEEAVEAALEIGIELGIDWEEVAFSPEQFAKGVKVEFMEHGPSDPETHMINDDIFAAAKIAWAHLKTLNNYYDELEQMEKEEKEEGKDTFDKKEDDDGGDSKKEEGEIGKSDKGFNPNFPSSGSKKTTGTYLSLCPTCKAIARTAYWNDAKCEVCQSQIRGYFWTHVSKELKQGGPREDVPDHLLGIYAQATKKYEKRVKAQKKT